MQPIVDELAEKGELNIAYVVPFDKLYNAGKAALALNQVHIEPDTSSKATSMLSLWKARLDEKLNIYRYHAITAKEFGEASEKFMLNIIQALKDDASILGEEFIGKEAEIALCIEDFWSPLFKPRGGNSNKLEGYVLQMLQLESNLLLTNANYSAKSGILLHPDKYTGKEPCRAYVPPKNYFPNRLQALTIADVLTLWNKNEQTIFALSIGRALIGRNGSISHEGKAISHGWRTFPILYGKEPGQGKSTICTKLLTAMQNMGYRVANFKTLARTFNMGRVVQADIAYRDDFTSNALSATLLSDDAKPIISGASIEVQDKGTNALEMQCNCLLLANVNKFDPNIRFKLDGGIVDRVKFLTTLSNLRLAQALENRDCLPALSRDTPSLKPHLHIPWLAEKLSVSEDLLMQYFCRLCMDLFITELDACSLEKTVREASARLETTLDGEHGESFATALVLARMLKCKSASELDAFRVPELTPRSLFDCLTAYADFAYRPETHHMRSFLKLEWERENRPISHPWRAISNMLSISVIRACDVLCTFMANSSSQPGLGSADKYDITKATTFVYSGLLTNEGYQLGKGLPYILEDWQHAKNNADYLRKMAKQIMISDAKLDDEKHNGVALMAQSIKWNADDFAFLNDFSTDREAYAYSDERHTGKLMALKCK